MVDGGGVDRRRVETVPVQARLGELDHMLVAMCNRTLGEFVGVRLRRLDLLYHRGLPAEAGVKPASRLPGIAQRGARSAVANERGDITEFGGTGDPMDKGDRRPDVVRVREVDPRKYFGEFVDKRRKIASRIDQPDYRRKLDKADERGERDCDVSGVVPPTGRDDRHSGD